MEDILEKTNRVLLVMDVSNFEYLTMWAAFNKWKQSYPEDSSVVQEASETDQTNLPNLLNFDSFKRVLYTTTQKKLESLLWIAKSNHQMEIDIADGVDVVFTEDDHITNNFRKLKYPEYKAQRKLSPKMFDVVKIKNYIQDVIFKELEVETRLGYKIIKVDDCESDDIIAILMKKYENYNCRILISSDHDFLQLDGINQYDWWGNRVTRTIKNHDEFTMNAREYLYWKIIRGDTSDNIKSVFPKVGDVKSYKLIKDKPKLLKMLSENQEAFNRYTLNKTLIDFREIPKDVVERIENAIESKMNESSHTDDFDDFLEKGCIDI